METLPHLIHIRKMVYYNNPVGFLYVIGLLRFFNLTLTVMKKTTRLRGLLTRSGVDFLMEAHNGLSAKIVEEAGFEGIWGSGLSLSAMMGVRDNNELSWTQVLEIVETMSDATSIPILLDGDTGYGNFNNMRRLVRKLEQREVAGVCIEDKLFPKTNSFLRGTTQKLADIEEFTGKIKAAKDTQRDDDFVLVARVEALIAGLGQGEALKRAEAYRQAGADAIFIHSKTDNPDQVFEFLTEWDNRHPIVIVPTTYYQPPMSLYEGRGINLIIWANHLLRASIKNMQLVAKTIQQEGDIAGIGQMIAPLSEVFRIQGDAELKSAEKKYLPQPKTEIVL